MRPLHRNGYQIPFIGRLCMRDTIIAGNWKMNKDAFETADFCQKLKSEISELETPKLRVVIAPSFALLSTAKEALEGGKIEVSAQDVSASDQGAFTGEVSASMLASIKVAYAIVGHSERRQYHHESNDLIRAKVQRLLEAEIIPILCIGETLEEREADETKAVLEAQIKGCLSDIELKSGKQLLIAYEPVWAIGTGKTATSAQAQDAHLHIRYWLKLLFGSDIAQSISILYGGSMKPENCEELISQPDIDGGLIGGASLKVGDFASMIKMAAKLQKKD